MHLYIIDIFIFHTPPSWSMGLKDDLGSRAIIAIGLILFGVILLLIRSIGIYILHTGNYSLNEDFLRWQLLSYGLSHLGQFIIGIGFFLFFMMINERLNINKHFNILNIVYLVLITPKLYFSQVYFFENYLFNAPNFISNLFHFGLLVIPAISYLFFVILLLLIFITLLKTKRSEKNDSITLDNRINNKDKNSKDKVIPGIE